MLSTPKSWLWVKSSTLVFILIAKDSTCWMFKVVSDIYPSHEHDFVPFCKLSDLSMTFFYRIKISFPKAPTFTLQTTYFTEVVKIIWVICSYAISVNRWVLNQYARNIMSHKQFSANESGRTTSFWSHRFDHVIFHYFNSRFI